MTTERDEDIKSFRGFVNDFAIGINHYNQTK